MYVLACALDGAYRHIDSNVHVYAIYGIRFTRVLNWVYSVSFVVYLLIGELPFLAYGKIHSTDIISFLTFVVSGSLFTVTSSTLVLTAVIGYPLQLAPVISIISDRLEVKPGEDG